MADDIRQLVISPYSNYLAILTTHTVHIAILPDSSHLTSDDVKPLRLKTYTLGPVTHVTSQSAVVSALWHPLGVNGSCLVTVTEDAVVRVWELSTTDRWSFDRPTLSIDMKKLADGMTMEQDFTASASNISKGFSPDQVEMEVASAAFPSRGSGGWAPMTLWVAMREGDVYALCPLLPEKWAPPPTLIPSLSISIVSKVARLEDDAEATEYKKLLGQQQLAWMADLDNQDPAISESPAGQEPADVYTRPQKPGRIPRLQGPFECDLMPEDSQDELDTMLSDIFVVGPKTNMEDLMDGEDEDVLLDEIDQEGLSAGIICLLSPSGRVSICLDFDGVEAQWLPTRRTIKHKRHMELSESPSLLTFQVLETLRPDEIHENGWPMFSADSSSRYSFFTTHAAGVTYMSLTPWVFRLESELQGDAAAGTDFRVNLLAKGQSSIRERLITEDTTRDAEPLALSAAICIRDPDLGYFLLTGNTHGPLAVTFETPEEEKEIEFRRSISRSRTRSLSFDSFSEAPEPEPLPLQLVEPRVAYVPSRDFDVPSGLPAFLQRMHHTRYKRLFNEPVRLSPATLTILTDAHKILSDETHRLGTAAAELFRRCEKLQLDLRDQIARVAEVAHRIDAVVGNDVEEGDLLVPQGGNRGLEMRISAAYERHEALQERLERLRRVAVKGSAGGRPLSDKEAGWVEEVKALAGTVMSSEGEGGRPATPPSWKRFEEVKGLKERLVDEAEQLGSRTGTADENQGRAAVLSPVRVSSAIRNRKVKQVMDLLERESALIEGAKARLERLTLV